MKKALGLSVAIILLSASQSWAPPGGVGTGLPIRNLQDLQNVEASSLASDQDALIWDSTSQSYIHSPSGGSGDVTGVGDCTDGACLDGTSDGGTNIALYDGDSNKVTISSGNLAGDITMVLPTDDGNNLEFLQTNGAGTLAWAAPAGGGDVTGVGDCISGACLDGTSDGGTTISLYDGDSHKGTLDLADAVGDVTITLQAVTGTVYVTGGTDVADADVADNITIDLAATATALAANGGNCAAGEIPLGVDASGAAEGCYEPSEADISDLSHVATAITDNLIVEADLNVDEAPADNDILTYDTTGANFSWQTPAELSLQPLEATLTDIADGTIAEDLVNTANPWAVNEGGTGAATFTDGYVLLGSGTGAITALNLTTDGAFLVGDGTTDPVAETGATARTSMGVGTGDTPQFTGIEVGAAADTSLTRKSAGVLQVETNELYVQGGTDVAIADGGTGASTAAAAVAALDAGKPMESRTIGGTALTITTYPIMKAPVGITITDIHCITDTGTVILQLEEGTATAYDGGVVVDATITCDSNGAEDDGSLTNGTIDANDWIAARIGTEASSPTILGFTFFYTVD